MLNLCEFIQNNEMCAKYTNLNYHYCDEHYFKKLANDDAWYSCFFVVLYKIFY